MQLSPHFTLQELTKSQTAKRRNIDNTPTNDQIENLRRLCVNILEPVRIHYDTPIVPSSGFRCIELNRAIGSSDSSQHTEGRAVDFEISGVANPDLVKFIYDNLNFDQLILEFYEESEGPNSGWVHCSFVSESENRNEVLIINSSGASYYQP